MSGFRQFQQASAEVQERDETMCGAKYCPCRSSVSLGGGAWLCSAHAFGPPDHWPAISEELRKHSWLIDLMADLRKDAMAVESVWRGYATKFWSGVDDHCIPDPNESIDSYLYRMHLELLYRVGSRTKRPNPHITAAPQSRRFGNLAENFDSLQA